MIGVLLIDDHPIVRAGCRRLLESRGGVRVLEAKTAAEGLALFETAEPDIVVLDVNLPDRGGLDLLRELRARRPGLRVVMFSMYEDAAFVSRALAAGAMGYVSKNDDPETLIEAIDRVLAGEVHLGRSVAQTLALMAVRGPGGTVGALTPREREVLALLAEGKALGEIAGALGISYRTVANVCSQLKTKLKVATLAGLVRIAVEEHRSGALAWAAPAQPIPRD